MSLAAEFLKFEDYSAQYCFYMIFWSFTPRDIGGTYPEFEHINLQLHVIQNDLQTSNVKRQNYLSGTVFTTLLCFMFLIKLL